MGLRRHLPPLQTAWPELASELAEALRAQGDEGLAAQVGSLEIRGFCYCGEFDCCTFYTRHRGQGGESIDVDAATGLIVVDVDPEGRITGVEILDRPDLYPAYVDLKGKNKRWL